MELQQLGLPRDICTAIVRAFQQAKEPLRTKLALNVLSRQSTSSTACLCRSHTVIDAHPITSSCYVSSLVPRLNSLDWRVDYLLSSSYLNAADTNNIRLQLRVQPPNAGTPPAALNPSAPLPASSALDSLLATGVAPELLSFSLTPTDFKLLYADLKQAKQLFAHV
jgi:hypothetical protein